MAASRRLPGGRGRGRGRDLRSGVWLVWLRLGRTESASGEWRGRRGVDTVSPADQNSCWRPRRPGSRLAQVRCLWRADKLYSAEQVKTAVARPVACQLHRDVTCQLLPFNQVRRKRNPFAPPFLYVDSDTSRNYLAHLRRNLFVVLRMGVVLRKTKYMTS